MLWYQFIDDKLQGNQLIGANIIGTPASVQLNWQSQSVLVNNVDIVGGVIQSWLSIWFTQEGIFHQVNPATQTWPDFWIPINTTNGIVNMPIEVKSFKKGASPAFDISDFDLYIRSITQDPSKLNCDYLIFEYEVLPTGVVLTQYWWKKVWQIVGRKKNTHLVTTQNRERNGVYIPNNLRPFKFFSSKATTHHINSRLEFAQLLNSTCLNFYPTTHSPMWLSNLRQNYLMMTSEIL